MFASDYLMRAVWTNRRTSAAERTAVTVKKYLFPPRQPLGIMAPLTAQRTPFQIDHGTDTRSVVGSQMLYVEKNTDRILCIQISHLAFDRAINASCNALSNRTNGSVCPLIRMSKSR